MSYVKEYTSTGSKLIHHPEVIQKLQKGTATPISLQIAPTSLCNLNCDFCSNSNREKHEEIDCNELYAFIEQMKKLGTKTVEWTGGGDPTLYTDINDSIFTVRDLGLKQGFITNGLAVDNLEPGALENLHWMRISMNCLDYGKRPIIPNKQYFEGTLGFSYVWNNRTSPEILKELDEFVKEVKPAYVRIVPNCLTTTEQQEANNRILGHKVKQMGEPYFYQDKVFKKPEFCLWHLFKPFLLHDGWVYPCSSVVLNDTADKQFHSKYRVCRMEEFNKLYEGPIFWRSSEKCSHCVFCDQNEEIINLLEPKGMEDFV